MKQIYSFVKDKSLFILSLLLVFGVMPAHSLTIGNLSYSLNSTNMTASVSAQDKDSFTGDIIEIPSTVTENGKVYTVTSVAKSGFQRCTGFSGTIILPNTLKTIGQSAFEDCLLTKIILPPSVSSIGQDAFQSSNLSIIICQGYEPPIGPMGANVGTMALSYATVYIPKNCLETYRTDPSAFRNFNTIVEVEDNELGISPARPDFTLDNTNIVIFPGQTTDISLSMSNATNYKNFKFYLQLPTGLSIDNASLNSSLIKYHYIYTRTSSTGTNSTTYEIEVTGSNVFTGGENLVNITLKATDDFKGGTIYFKNGTATTYTGSKTVNLRNQSFIVLSTKVPDGFDFKTDDSDVKQDTSTTASVSLSGGDNFSYSGFQFDVVVPDGFSLTNIIFNATLSGFNPLSNKIDNNTYRFIAYKSDGKGITTKTDLVKFDLQLSKSTAIGIHEIKITNIIFSSVIGLDIPLNDKTISINVENGEILVNKITLSPTSGSLKVNETQEFTATVSPSDATNQSIKWTIKDSTIASISTENGNKVTVKGLKVGGTTTLIATAQDRSEVKAEATITVVATPVTSISVKAPAGQSTTLRDGKTLQLTATISPSDATYQNVKWTSSDDTKATVDENGLVTAHSTLGSVTITATSENYSSIKGIIQLTIEATPVETISLATKDGASTNLKDGQTLEIIAAIDPNTATDKGLTWASSDDLVATVSNDGVVTAHAKVGEATITATSISNPNIKGTIKVKVEETSVTTIAVKTENNASTTLKDGNTLQLIATVTPLNATYPTVKWSTSDATIATVDENSGMVIAHAKIGPVTITATSEKYPDVKGTIELTIEATPVETISLSPKDGASTTLRDGQTLEIVATFNPSNATYKSLTWESSDEDVATVDENSGLVTAHAKCSSVVITASSVQYPEVKNSIILTVQPTLVESIEIKPENDAPSNLRDKETIKLIASFTPSTTTNKGVRWSSEDEEIASVDQEGHVTAKAKIGKTIITAQSEENENVKGEFEINIIPTPVTHIEINVSDNMSKILRDGEQRQLLATVSPANATYPLVKWSSSDPSIASVDVNSGLVTAYAKVGQATITATCEYDNVSSEIVIEVIATQASTITLEPTAKVLSIGGEKKLEVKISPETTTDKTITWVSSDNSVCAVTDEGIIKGISTGDAIITAKCGEAIATCEVTVISGTISTNDFTLRAGQTEKFDINIDLEPRKDLEYTAYQFNVVLPEHLSLTNVKFNDQFGDGFYNDYNETNNKITFIGSGLPIGSSNVYSEIVEITVSADIDVEADSESVLITDVKFVIDDEDIILNNSSAIVNYDKPLTNIAISQDALEIYVKGTCNLKANVSPQYATNKNITWKVSDNSKDLIEIIENNGYEITVMGLKLGEATVTAESDDWSNIKATAIIKVVPTPASSILIENKEIAILKEREEIQLITKVSPFDTTYPEVEWITSDSSVATVSNEGLVEAVGNGEVTITARVKATPSVYDVYELTVESLLIGDANDDGIVDVFDVVTIGNYIAGKKPQPFRFVAADVIYDKIITVADQTAAANIALGKSISAPLMGAMQKVMSVNDMLHTDETLKSINGKLQIPVYLENIIGYTAIQADISVPFGMRVDKVTLGQKATHHNLIYNITDEGTLKVVIFNFNNEIFADGSNSLFEIELTTFDYSGQLNIENIYASTPTSVLYDLSYRGGNIEGTSGINTMYDEGVIIKGGNGSIEIWNAEGEHIEIYYMNGRKWGSILPVSNHETILLSKGIYLVRTKNSTIKVII